MLCYNTTLGSGAAQEQERARTVCLLEMRTSSGHSEYPSGLETTLLVEPLQPLLLPGGRSRSRDKGDSASI
jgi:hypothetical protein